jgi:hypothetical protein
VKRIWIIVAAALAITALVFSLQSNYEYAFIAATLGAVSWFLSYRVQMRELIGPDKTEDDMDDEEFHDDENN